MIRYIVISLVSIVVGILLATNCQGNKNNISKTVVKYDTIVKNKTITIVKDRPIVKYIRDVKYITNKDTIIKDFKPSDYSYTINDTINKDGNVIRFNANGWGNIDRYSFEMDIKEKTITKTIENTIIKNPNELFLYGQYTTPFENNNVLKPIYTIGLDYTIGGKVIIGISAGLQDNNPVYSGKIGFKIN